MSSRHRDFRAYSLASELADVIRNEVDHWDSFDLWTVGVQMVRAADSVGANIAEGFGRGAGADRRRMFLIARGSVTETEHWLDRAAKRGLLNTDPLDAALGEVSRLLNGLIRAERA
jgi:four helix bundle protein